MESLIIYYFDNPDIYASKLYVDDSWTERTYPFAESRRLAQEFAKQEGDERTTRGWLTRTQREQGWSSRYI